MPFGDVISTRSDSFEGERRQSARHVPDSLAYVHLDENNGGILINLSESGLAVQAAVAVMEDDIPRLRLQMPRSKTWLETGARVVWTGDSRRTVGIEFLNSTDDFRKHLREWLGTGGSTAAAAAEGFPPETENHAAAIEEIPLRGSRAPSQARLRTGNPADFDVADLLKSREMASVTVARSIKMPAEHARAVPAIAPISKEPAPEVSEEHLERPRPKSAGYVSLVIVLAVVSLAAGWEAARGNVFQTVRALFLPSAAASASKTTRPAISAIANGLATNFEVIDSNNQAWLVPFSGPTSAPAGAVLPALPAKTVAKLNEPPPSPVSTFRTSNLVAPLLSSRSKAAGGSAAPIVTTPQGGSLPAAIVEAGEAFRLTPPPEPSNATPNPAVHSSLVEPKLVRTVQPLYPTAALSQHVEGLVSIHARIEADGSVSNVSALSGPPLLISAAVNAVREWKYKPEMLDGRAVASDVTVTVKFTSPH
ncbi:MAG TPA: TonB family protein [Candidatus Acidoferrales bacterium]|nr:TonB family protein [Candidatus Acidoferrales bacterium]